jgi:glycine oxidase
MQHADVIIAGAGIIGLSTALELASAGKQVVVFERSHAMRESSWAAAGMLAATDPENPAALRPLSKLSRNLYPEFLAKVEALSGKKIPIRTRQTLQGARTLPPGIESLSAKTIDEIVPGLQPSSFKFFLLEEQSFDPRDLARALPEAVKAAGVTLIEQNAVGAITSQPNSVQIQTSHGEWSAANFINACGAWAADLAGIPITPRKGQMLLIEHPDPQKLAVVLRTPELYLVPRGDGRILVGATVENAGYDKQIDPSAIAALHNAAADLWPPIREAQMIDTWSGLRPASPDSLPVIGESSPNIWLAVGHFRNGILLAPGTARLLRQMILREPFGIDVSVFRDSRFALLKSGSPIARAKRQRSRRIA